MSSSISQKLADFVTGTTFDDLPSDVVKESKRILLDSIGCGIGGIPQEKSRIAIDFAKLQGTGDHSATVFGSSIRSSIFGAAFANGETINALDFDAVLPPGHVSPYVLPGLLAIAEVDGSSGREVLNATAISHEITNRFGKAMDNIRDIVDGKHRMPEVLGYTNAVFGATSAITRLRDAEAKVTAHALSIAAATSPVNSHRSWLEHPPLSTIKYTMAGPVVHTSLTAAFMAMLGHRGDPAVLDDSEFGYPRFIGTVRWQPERMLRNLGDVWNFSKENSFKVYPHCRAPHGLFDLLCQILEENCIATSEIEAIRTWGEGHVERPCWTTRNIHEPIDAQMSTAHGIAICAQRLPNSIDWQDPKVANSTDVLSLMERITCRVHPEWARLVASDPAARPSRVEVDARSQTFSAELRYPKGTPGAAGGSAMSDDELVAKFRLNSGGALSDEVIERTIEDIFELEHISNVTPLLRRLGVQ